MAQESYDAAVAQSSLARRPYCSGVAAQRVHCVVPVGPAYEVVAGEEQSSRTEKESVLRAMMQKCCWRRKKTLVTQPDSLARAYNRRGWSLRSTQYR